MVQIQPRKEVLLNGITAGTAQVSRGVGVDSAGKLSLMVYGVGVTAGSATFYVEVTNDNTLGWVPYNRLVSNVTNTNAQNDTRVSLIQQTTTGTSIVFFPPGDTFNFVRVRADVWPTGTYSAVLYVN